MVLFVATWFTIPSGRYELKDSTTGKWTTKRVAYPARLFRRGIVVRDTTGFGRIYRRVALHTLRQRVVIFYGGFAVVIVLVGVAFGALRRGRVRTDTRQEW